MAAASLLTLADPIFDLTDTGPWAVITVVILMQQTLGATTQKAASRCRGTVVAAAAAMLTAFCCHSLPDYVAGTFLVCCVLVGTWALTLLSTAPKYASWQYAITMSCLSYVFLALLAYRERMLASFYRILMVVAGALIAWVASLAPPQLRARKQLRLILAENCCKTASAIGFAVDAFVTGRTLEMVEQFDAGQRSDDLHRNYREVITSRNKVEEAATAAFWEQARPGEWELSRYRELALLDRRIVYGLVAIDQLLRMPCTPIGRANATFESATIRRDLETASELMQAALHRLAHTSVCGTRHRGVSTAPEPFAMKASICALQRALVDLLRGASAVQKAESAPQFSRQVAVIQLVIDTALRVEALQEAAERAAEGGRVASASIPELHETPPIKEVSGH